MKLRRFISLAIVFALACASGAWYTVNADATVTVSGAPLSVATTPITFETVVLSGAMVTTHGATTGWTLKDPTGTGAGYHVNIRATDFLLLSDASKTIPVGGFRMALADSAVATIDGNPKPISQFFAMTVLTGNDQSFLYAAANTGMGTYTVLPTFTLDVPASTYAGSYISIVRVTIVSGP